MSYYPHRSAKVTVCDGGVTFQQSSGALTFAKIVHATRDADGRIIAALLDRHAHDEHTSYRSDDGEWSMSGCFVTEMTLRRTVEHDERVAARELIRGFVDAVVEADGVSRYRLCTTITDRILGDHQLVGFWGRDVLLDELTAWIVRELDGEDVAPLDLCESKAHRIVGMCRTHLGK